MKPRAERMFEKCVRYIRHNNQRRLFHFLARHREVLRHLETVNGHSLLQLAVWWQGSDMVEGLLQLGADPDLVHPGGETPLIHAAADNNIEMVRMLLRFGADIEKPNDQWETPLGFACAYEAVDVVRLLCEAGANVNGTEGWGHSYLFGAQCHSEGAPENHQAAEIVRVLIEHGAKVIHEEPKLPLPDSAD